MADKSKSGWGTPNQAKVLVIALVILGIAIWFAYQSSNYEPSF